MKRRVGVWAVLAVAVLVVTAAPASAASVASINTSDADFQQATLNGFDVVGSGESASAVAELGTRETYSVVATGDGSFSANKAGVLFELSAEREQIRATVSNTDNSRVQLFDHDSNTLLATATPDGTGDVVINQSLDASTTYRLVADDSGDGREYHDSDDNLPATAGALTVTAGYFGGSEESGTVYAFDSISTGYRHAVEYRGAEHSANADTLFADVDPGSGSATVRAQSNDGTGWSDVATTTVSSAQNVSLDISGDSSDRYRTVVEASSTGAQTVTLEDEGVTFTSGPLSLSNPDPADGSSAISDYDGSVSVDVADADFATPQGDSVTVEVANSQGTIGETTVTANGTASVPYAPVGGANNLTWTATDAYGNTATLSQDFVAPDQLTVVNVSNTSQLVSDVEVTIQFFQRDNDTVIRRTTSNGAISMTGLRVSETYLVTAQADGYVTRKAIVQPLGGQQTIYLLNDSEPSAEVIFELSDPTGDFPPESTYLYVEKPINVSGETEYRVITADTFGATGSYPVELQTDTRYRLRVVNNGEERALGAYTATGPAQELLQIQRIEPSADDRDTGVVYGDYNASSGALAVRFRGGDAETTVNYSVTDSAGNTVVAETSVTGSEFAHVYTLGAGPNETVSYQVNYQIERADGTVVSDSFTVGSLSGVAGRFDMDPQVLSIASWVAILAVMGLVVIVNKTLAPAAGAGMASVLTIIGTVAIPAPLLGVSGAIGVLVIIGGR